MKGAGYYSKATVGAKDVIDNATPLVLGAIDTMDFPDDGRIITMADMGCADGGTSIEMVRAALTAMRRKWPSCPIQMVYTDPAAKRFQPAVPDHSRPDGYPELLWRD